MCDSLSDAIQMVFASEPFDAADYIYEPYSESYLKLI